MGELATFDIHEWPGRQDRGEVLSHRVGLTSGPVHHFAEFGDPRNGFVAFIPQDTESPTLDEDPMDLFQCRWRVEPVEGLRHHDAVDRGVLEGYVDVATVEDLHGR